MSQGLAGDDAQELIDLQARPAYQGPVDIGLA